MLTCEYKPGQEVTLRIRVPRFLRPEARRHLRAARREALLALRGFLDRAIEAVEGAEKPETETKGANKS